MQNSEQTRNTVWCGLDTIVLVGTVAVMAHEFVTSSLSPTSRSSSLYTSSNIIDAIQNNYIHVHVLLIMHTVQVCMYVHITHKPEKGTYILGLCDNENSYITIIQYIITIIMIMYCCIK